MVFIAHVAPNDFIKIDAFLTPQVLKTMETKLNNITENYQGSQKHVDSFLNELQDLYQAFTPIQESEQKVLCKTLSGQTFRLPISEQMPLKQFYVQLFLQTGTHPGRLRPTCNGKVLDAESTFSNYWESVKDAQVIIVATKMISSESGYRTWQYLKLPL
jgi:hypothetical protein